MTSTHSTTPQSKYDELVAAIVKAVPEIEGKCPAPKFCMCEGKGHPREITLEDVLRATDKIVDGMETEIAIDTRGSWMHWDRDWLHKDLDGKTWWHLGYSLEWHRDNAPETIAFLHSLLHG